jgi:hypothetical protein
MLFRETLPDRLSSGRCYQRLTDSQLRTWAGPLLAHLFGLLLAHANGSPLRLPNPGAGRHYERKAA